MIVAASGDGGIAALSIFVVLFWGGLFWAAPIFVAHYLGKSRNRTGWLWGFFLGWLGVIILACMGNSEPPKSLEQLAIERLEQEVKIMELQERLAANTNRPPWPTATNQ